MRLRIVISHDPPKTGTASWRRRIDRAKVARATATVRTISAWVMAAVTLSVRLLGTAIRGLREAQCGFTGHDDVMKLQRRRLSLMCTRCGRVTPGWDLTDPTPPETHPEPRYFELVRKRS